MRDDKVIVIGAGPVGLTTACELALHGVQARVIDQRHRQWRHSKATVLWPRILELLERTGVTPKLLERAQQIPVVEFHGDGVLLKRIDLADIHDTRYPFALTLPQSEIETVLEERLDQLGGTVEREVSLTALEQGPTGVRVTLRHADGAEEQASHDWLVGADGASSTVRTLLGCEFPGFDVPVRFMLVDVAVSRGLKKGVGTYFFGRGGSLAVVPIGGDLFRIAGAMDADQSTDLDAPAIEEFVSQRAGVRCAVEKVVNVAEFRAQVRQAPSYRFGRVLLVGDAAHLTTPASGQGMNTGIQDAVNLGWRLAGVVLDRLDEAELDRYALERRTAVDHVQKVTTAQTEVVDSGYSSAAVPLMDAREISQIDSAYPSAGDFSGAGARVALPFGDLEPGRAALATIGPTVLLWPGLEWSSPEWTATVQAVDSALPEEIRVVDLAGKAPGHLAPLLGDVAVALVVRPDGHVAHRCAPADTVAELRENSPWLPTQAYVTAGD